MASKSILFKVVVCKPRYSSNTAFYPNTTFYFKVTNITDFHRLIEKVKRLHVNENQELYKLNWMDNEKEKNRVDIDPNDTDDFNALHEYSIRKGHLFMDINFLIRIKEVESIDTSAD